MEKNKECLSCHLPTKNKYCSDKCKQKYYYYNISGRRSIILNKRKSKYYSDLSKREEE